MAWADAAQINAHQYSATHFDRDLSEGARGKTQEGVVVSHGVQGLPGVFFNFEISPMRIIHSETRQSFAHFVTSCVTPPGARAARS